jgi:hypothetical protein
LIFLKLIWVRITSLEGGIDVKSSAMADDAPRVIWCLVKGDSQAFKITAKTSDDIYDLRTHIKTQRENRDATDFELWKVGDLFQI